MFLASFLGVSLDQQSALAEPIPLPYRAQGPFIPVFDLNGGAAKGLILSAQEVIRGRSVPITIGNATFIPEVGRAGQLYGGYMKVRGDLQIVGGDLYLGDRSLSGTLDQTRQQLTTQADQIRQQSGEISTLAAASTQAQRSIVRLEDSVSGLGETALRQGAFLQQQDQAIDALAIDMRHAKQAIGQLSDHLTSLGSGMAGATALASALSSVPNMSDDAPLTCGVGTGGYTSRYALAAGCAVRLGPNVSLNGAGSYLFGGAADYGSGTLSNIAGRIGIVYRFAPSASPTVAQVQAVDRLQMQLDEAKQLNQQMAERLDRFAQRLQSLESYARMD